MSLDGGQGEAPNYFPNSFSGPQPDRRAAIHKFGVSGDVARWNSADEDNFTQVGLFWNKVLTDKERDRLVDNIASHLCGAQEFLQERAIANFSQADPEYGRRIKELIKSKYGKQQANEVERVMARL